MPTFMFPFQKTLTFSNLLIEEPGTWFAVAKISEKGLKEKEILGKTTCIFT